MEVNLSQEVHGKLIPEFEARSRLLKPRFHSRSQLKAPRPKKLNADGQNVSFIFICLNWLKIC